MEERMGTFYEKITLQNSMDRGLAKRGYIREDQIRSVEVDAMPDTGAWTLIINEKTRQRLGLDTIDSVESTMADGTTKLYDLTETVEIRWKNRRTSHEAVVIPNAPDILLGAIPLEGMDLCVDPVNQRLVGVHGDTPVYIVY
jgi:clan AA aspartic protease